MATYEYNDKLKFVFPSGYMLNRSENDEGEEVVSILAGEYEDDDGETCYAFNCKISDLEYDPDDMDDDITSENLFDVVTDRFEGAKKVKVANDPETYFVCKPIPLQIFGRVMKMYGAITVIRFSDWTGINLISSNKYKDDQPEENIKVFESVYEVLKAIRIDGKKIPLDNISPETIQKVVEASFECDNETIDFSPTIKINIKSGDEVKSLEYTSEGMKEVEYDGEGFDVNMGDEQNTIDCDISPDRITDLHDELREALIDKIEEAGDYSYPETEDFSISGTFTEEPDFDVLEEICEHACEEADSAYDGDWSASQLFDFLKKEIGNKKEGNSYYISPSFGGLSPVLALLPFLAAYSDIHSLEVTFTHDKWEARGDYSSSERVGIKLKNGEFVVGKYSTDDDFDDDYDDDFDNDDDEDDNEYVDYSIRSQQAADAWMDKYGKYVEKNPVINFNGTLFVFSGLAGHWEEKDQPLVQKVIERGGQYRSKVSGITNYLVVNPQEAGQSKIVSAIEQKNKGKGIKVVLQEDLERALGEKVTTSTSYATATTTTTTTSKTSTLKAQIAKTDLSDFEIDEFGSLTDYTGSATDIVIPDGVVEVAENAFSCKEDIVSVVIPEGVETIGDSAFTYCSNLKKVTLPSTLRKIEGNGFYSCKKLTSVVIPEGCEEIGEDAFTFCENLKDIYVPESVYDISTDAFKTFCDFTVIHTPAGSVAEAYAIENDLKVDHQSAAVKSSSTKSSTIKASTTKTTSATKSTSTSSTAKVAAGDFKIDASGNVTGYTGSKKDIVLPDGIVGIAEDAFLSNDDITSVVIPEGVEIIDNGAFWMCANLKSVTLPSTVRKIGENAFNSCEELTKIIIPEGCEEIGTDAFTSCKKLKDIYVPKSVYEFGDDAFCTFCPSTVIHTPAGSKAEKYATENNCTVDHKSAPTTATVPKPQKKATPVEDADDSGSFADAISDMSAQIAEMESQDLTPEQRAALEEASGLMEDIHGQLTRGQEVLSKGEAFFAQKEAREKAEKEERERKKAEALAAGKSEKDIVNMYIILTNEKKLGHLHRSPEEFYEIYEEDFDALSKSEVLQTRKDMLAEMEDEALCSYYAESFRQRSVKDRFTTSTLNLNNVSDEPDYTKKAEFAIRESQEWFTPEEYAEVRKLMDEDLADTRKQLDEQLKTIEEKWIPFRTAKDCIHLYIKEKNADGSDMSKEASCFQRVIGRNVVSVKLATQGESIFVASSQVMNFNPWYWSVTIRDIWEAAYNNALKDERAEASDGSQIAKQALEQIRTAYPETKVTPAPSTTSYFQPQATGTSTASKPKTVATSTSQPKTTATTNNENTTNTSKPSSTQPTQPAKKEGCYIATAVYGSYDAPQVMTLRRFRDETLRKSVLGRWFIRTYYRLSPPIAEKLKNAKRINALVRSILDKWVNRLNKKQH